MCIKLLIPMSLEYRFWMTSVNKLVTATKLSIALRPIEAKDKLAIQDVSAVPDQGW